VTYISGTAYAADDQGTVWAIDGSTLGKTWSYRDTTNHNTCTTGQTCQVLGGVYVHAGHGRVYWGDGDGHIYGVSTSAGTTLSASYPFRPNSTTEAFATPVLFVDGTLVAGTSSGSVFIINANSNGSHLPVLRQTYQFGSAVSGISYHRLSATTGSYMIGTANGRLYYISKVTDSDGYN
jgi:outer membrane protein assembly factor BamB